jgi:hypothetical protein
MRDEYRHGPGQTMNGPSWRSGYMPLSGAAFAPSLDDQLGITPGATLDFSGYVSWLEHGVPTAQVPFSGDTPT